VSLFSSIRKDRRKSGGKIHNKHKIKRTHTSLIDSRHRHTQNKQNKQNTKANEEEKKGRKEWPKE